MALNRKGLRLALLAALQKRMAASGINEFLTKEIEASAAASVRFPILVLQAADETPEVSDRGEPPIWHESFDVVMYVQVSPVDLDPDAQLDVLVTHLEAALEAQPSESTAGWWTNLGGACSRAFPSGQVQRYQAANLAWAVVPVEIRAAGGMKGVP